LRLDHVEAAVLVSGSDAAAVARIRDALESCVARVREVEGVSSVAALCSALESCKAHALLAASDALGGLEPRVALALIAGMPARGGPQLVAFERGGRADLRLVLVRADVLERIRGASQLEALEGLANRLLIPAGWLARAAASS
jgi:hypothetical protein